MNASARFEWTTYPMTAFGVEVDKDAVCVFEAGVSKHEALDRLVDAVAHQDAIRSREALRRAVYEREAIVSTGIGRGVAIPHVRIDEVAYPCLGVGTSRDGIDFGTLDDQPVHVMVLFAMPSGSQRDYLGMLAGVMTALKRPGFADKLALCADTGELLALLNEDEG